MRDQGTDGSDSGAERAEDVERAAPAAGAASTPGDPALEEDLQATADSILADTARLAAIEGEKRSLRPADPDVDRLSDEAVGLADRIARETRAERQLSDEID